MAIVTGTKAETKEDYAELAQYFLSESPKLIKLWEKQKDNDEHSRMLYEAGVEYLASK